MKVTVNVVCYKSKTLSNGEHPLMLRICKEGKKKYVSLGISVSPKYWDFTLNRPKRNHPQKNELDIIISKKIEEYSQEILTCKIQEEEFTPASLIGKISRPQKSETVESIFKKKMNSLISEGRLNYMLSYKQLYNSVKAFNVHVDFYFSNIDVSWLKAYERWMRKQNLSDNTIAIRFRTFRSLYNFAIQEKAVKADLYPFTFYKVSKLSKETPKRSISKQDFLKIINHHTKKWYVQFAIDVFAFTYYVGGINFVDIAYLTSDNIVDNKIIYARHKTKKLIKIPLQDEAIHLIEKYKVNGNLYLFPILSSYHKTDIQKANRIHKVISQVNRHLKEIGQLYNMPIKITTYVARHTQATVLKKAGVPTSIIKEVMGHSSEKITQIYLDSFDNEQINDALKNLR